MPTVIPTSNIPTLYASSLNPPITTINLTLYGITPTTPGMLQRLGPPHLRLINYSPALLILTFPSSFRHYLGPLDELIVDLSPDDLSFSYVPQSWLPNPYNYGNKLVMTYYASGESFPLRTTVQPTTTPYDAWLGALDVMAADVTVPAAGATVNVGGLYSVASAGLNIPYVLTLRSVLLQWDGQGAGAGGIKYDIGVDLQTAGNVSVGGGFPFYFIRYNNDWPAIAGPYAGLNLVLNKAWASTSFIPSSFSGSSDHFVVVFHCVSKSNAPAGVILNVQADVIPGAWFTPNNT